MQSLKFGLILSLALFTHGGAESQSGERSIDELAALIGDWEGTSTLFSPRRPEAKQRWEDVTFSCDWILKRTYIACDTKWTRRDKYRNRTFKLFFNYNSVDEGYQTLFIYDNWPRSVSYLIQGGEARGQYIGFVEFESGDGVSGKERIVWQFSEDGNQLSSDEYNHMETDPDGEWRHTFTFSLDRKSQASVEY